MKDERTIIPHFESNLSYLGTRRVPTSYPLQYVVGGEKYEHFHQQKQPTD